MTLQSWIDHKEQGKLHFQNNQYTQALACYLQALSLNPPLTERQILLSNVVACRLKLGQVMEALQDAKECVAMNDSWAKAHVRLASAYSMAGQSNDACNALQRALLLDPTNTTARQMLRAELRRGGDQPQPSAPPEETNDDNIYTNGATPTNHQTQGDSATQLEESLSWFDRLQFEWNRVLRWYQGQSDDSKALVSVALGILVLYVAFGGRFGLESKQGRPTRGNYSSGNAYDRYRNTQQQRRTQTSYESPIRDTGTAHGGEHTIFLMIVLAVVGYICHMNGINPFHAMFMLNVMPGNRGRGMNRMGMYGMGYGMARQQFFGGRNAGGQNHFRPRNGWY